MEKFFGGTIALERIHGCMFFFVERKMRVCESLDILEIEIRESTIGRIFLEGYSHIGD